MQDTEIIMLGVTRGTQLASRHYDDGELTTSFDGEMDVVYGNGQETILRAHLSRCTRCAEAMAKVVALAGFVDHFLKIEVPVHILEDFPTVEALKAVVDNES